MVTGRMCLESITIGTMLNVDGHGVGMCKQTFKARSHAALFGPSAATLIFLQFNVKC